MEDEEPEERWFTGAATWVFREGMTEVEEDELMERGVEEDAGGFAAAADDVGDADTTGINVVAIEDFAGAWKNSPPLTEVEAGLEVEGEVVEAAGGEVVVSSC